RPPHPHHTRAGRPHEHSGGGPPPQLPDLFHGTQLVVLGRYTGDGHVAIKLTGNVGKEAREFVYEVAFPQKTGDERNFVEDLWARRKVGYLLDQIRANGEKKELVDEVVALAKRYGITTPYTSYRSGPDARRRVAGAPKRADGKPDVRFHLGRTAGGFGGPGHGMMGGGFGGATFAPPGLSNGPTAQPTPVATFARTV